MSTSVEDYDKMSEEERKAKDKADREREVTEQAGRTRFTSTLMQLVFDQLGLTSLTLQMDTIAWRS